MNGFNEFESFLNRFIHRLEGFLGSFLTATENFRFSLVEQIEYVRRALKQLSPRDRRILLMREEGFRYGEIADAIGVKQTSVGALVARALRRFETAWAELDGANGSSD